MQNVLVPFLGSGATLRAAYNRGLTAYGFDANAEYKDRFLLAVEEDTRALYASSKDED
jgi:DNA modification methylase